MPIAIIGAKGNMARRYAAILHHLGKASWGIDAGYTERQLEEISEHSDGFIIATPTDTHTDWIRKLAHLKKPILCEKPVSKSIPDLKEALGACQREGTPFDMVFQYQHLTVPSIGLSYYNYWNHGRDGLIWDCIQIIGLARGKIRIDEYSPIWKCWINGHRLKLNHMDHAYIAMMKAWLKEPGCDHGRVIAIHEKTADMERESGRI